MGFKPAYDLLSEVIEGYESNGTTVLRVDTEASDRGGHAELRATMDLPVDLCASSGDGGRPAPSPRAASLAEAGGLQVEFAPPALPELPSLAATAVSTSEEDARVTDDGELLLTVAVTIDAAAAAAAVDREEGAASAAGDEGGAATAAGETGATPAADGDGPGSDVDRADELPAVRTEGVPPYEDVEYLQRLYDACDTFVEMGRRIEMDVSSETVRRYMIDAGVHAPASYDTESGGDDAESETGEGEVGEGETGEGEVGEGEAVESGTSEGETSESEAVESEGVEDGMGTDDEVTAEPGSARAADDGIKAISGKQLVTDGIGLPGGLRLEDVADAVVESGTVYEVQRHLGLERQRTRDLLKQLNLLDLVSCRLADSQGREVSYGEVASRISQCAPGG